MTDKSRALTPVIVHENECETEEWNDETRGFVRWKTLISADRTDTVGLTCGVAELPVGSSRTVNLHRHAPIELYYILQGEGLLRIDGMDYEVSTGSTAFIPANSSHGLVNTGSSVLRLLYVFPVDSFAEVEYVFPDAE